MNSGYKFDSLELTRTRPFVNRVFSISAVIVGVFVLVLFLPWMQTVEGTGKLMALNPSERPHNVSATIDGFVEDFHVGENEKVREGDKLFTMRDLDRDFGQRVRLVRENLKKQYENNMEEIELLLKNKEAAKRQKSAQLDIFENEYRGESGRYNALLAGYEALKRDFQTKESNYKRMERLYSEKIESQRSYEVAQNAFKASEAALKRGFLDLEIQRVKMDSLLKRREKYVEEVDSGIREIEKSVLTAQTRSKSLLSEIAKQETVLGRYDKSEVFSEKEGVVVRILKNDKNLYIKKGEAVMRFAPKVKERTFLVKISDFNMPLMKEGLKARIRFHGWPVLHVPGWPAIRFGTFGGIVKKVDPVLHEDGYHYIYITEDPDEPWPDCGNLKIGTNANVWVALESVPIWYQIWRLLNAFPANMVHPDGVFE